MSKLKLIALSFVFLTASMNGYLMENNNQITKIEKGKEKKTFEQWLEELKTKIIRTKSYYLVNLEYNILFKDTFDAIKNAYEIKNETTEEEKNNFLLMLKLLRTRITELETAILDSDKEKIKEFFTKMPERMKDLIDNNKMPPKEIKAFLFDYFVWMAHAISKCKEHNQSLASKAREKILFPSNHQTAINILLSLATAYKSTENVKIENEKVLKTYNDLIKSFPVQKIDEKIWKPITKLLNLYFIHTKTVLPLTKEEIKTAYDIFNSFKENIQDDKKFDDKKFFDSVNISALEPDDEKGNEIQKKIEEKKLTVKEELIKNAGDYFKNLLQNNKRKAFAFKKDQTLYVFFKKTHNSKLQQEIKNYALDVGTKGLELILNTAMQNLGLESPEKLDEQKIENKVPSSDTKNGLSQKTQTAILQTFEDFFSQPGFKQRLDFFQEQIKKHQDVKNIVLIGDEESGPFVEYVLHSIKKESIDIYKKIKAHVINPLHGSSIFGYSEKFENLYYYIFEKESKPGILSVVKKALLKMINISKQKFSGHLIEFTGCSGDEAIKNISTYLDKIEHIIFKDHQTTITADNKNFTLHYTSGENNNCLLYSILKHHPELKEKIHQNTEDYNNIRKIIINNIFNNFEKKIKFTDKENPTIFEFLSQSFGIEIQNYNGLKDNEKKQALKEFLQERWKEGEFLDEQFAVVMSVLYGFNLIRVSPGQTIHNYSHISDNKDMPTIYIYHAGKNHFEALSEEKK